MAGNLLNWCGFFSKTTFEKCKLLINELSNTKKGIEKLHPNFGLCKIKNNRITRNLINSLCRELIFILNN